MDIYIYLLLEMVGCDLYPFMQLHTLVVICSGYHCCAYAPRLPMILRWSFLNELSKLMINHHLFLVIEKPLVIASSWSLINHPNRWSSPMISSIDAYIAYINVLMRIDHCQERSTPTMLILNPYKYCQAISTLNQYQPQLTMINRSFPWPLTPSLGNQPPPSDFNFAPAGAENNAGSCTAGWGCRANGQ